MAQIHTDTNINQLIINKLTKQEYNNLPQVSNTELYLVEESLDSVVTEGSTNPVQSGAIYEALQDIGSAINDGTTSFIKNNHTVGVISANQALDKTITIPNDIIMCKMSDGIVYDSYITYTKIKQYLPDYPYYSDDLNWEIGGNPPRRANITADNYYLDVDTNHIFVADENLELLDITSSVVIHGDINKLYCDVNTNILYRYYGTNFVALTNNFSGNYNDLSNKPLSIENNKVKYTLSDGTTKLTLAQESDVKDIPITFTSDTSAARANIQSGDTLSEIAKKLNNFIYNNVVYYPFRNVGNISIENAAKYVVDDIYTNSVYDGIRFIIGIIRADTIIYFWGAKYDNELKYCMFHFATAYIPFDSSTVEIIAGYNNGNWNTRNVV